MKTKCLFSALLLCLLSLTYVANAWSGYVNKDTTLANVSYWKKVIPAHNDAPSQCDYIHNSQDSYIFEFCYDAEGSDWSDVVAYQGKALHTSGTWGTTLNYNPVFWRDKISQYTIRIDVQMKFSYRPQIVSTYPWYPWISPASSVAGAFVLLYFEFYYSDNNGNWQWSNINNPNAKDNIPDCFIFEQANRWYYNGAVWVQASSSDISFNFFTAHTTHDDDLHDIRCGWTWTEQEMNNQAWKTFTVIPSTRMSEWFAWFDNWCQNEGWQRGIANIKALRLVAVAMSVETYRASFPMRYCDLWVYAVGD